ncbi:hypothetical protein GGX14DRAFT_578234 [Mycena pura]|uniref:Uncharacterized protein n=1 Tax=Mycena pura TaxID=153505 RepID=A0AAD6UQD2_9AGAR|nr:hypothetical protein GGX14DRAFT_578234 [Mycena pura]
MQHPASLSRPPPDPPTAAAYPAARRRAPPPARRPGDQAARLSVPPPATNSTARRIFRCPPPALPLPCRPPATLAIKKKNTKQRDRRAGGRAAGQATDGIGGDSGEFVELMLQKYNNILGLK